MPRNLYTAFSSRCADSPITFFEDVSSSVLPLENSPLKIGDHVGAGMPLVEDLGDNLIVHAPFDALVDNIIIHKKQRYYYLKRNGEEAPPSYTAKEPLKHSAAELILRLRLCGVEDGGEALWLKVKKARGLVQSIVINAVEPEAFFYADSRIFLEQTKEVLLGAEYLRTLTKAKDIIIVLPKGSELLDKLAKITKGLGRFYLHETELRYPRAYDGFILAELFKNKGPYEAAVFRPSGLLAAEEALLFHKPHTELVVSVDGAFCAEHGNFRLPIGTPFHNFLRPFSGVNSYVIINGGPMAGSPADPKKGVNKNTKAVLVFMPLTMPEETECTFCGLCVEHCPCRLNPIRLYDMIAHKEFSRANIQGRGACIGCNACSCVCPSYIPLGRTIKGEKNIHE